MTNKLEKILECPIQSVSKQDTSLLSFDPTTTTYVATRMDGFSYHWDVLEWTTSKMNAECTVIVYSIKNGKFFNINQYELEKLFERLGLIGSVKPIEGTRRNEAKAWSVVVDVSRLKYMDGIWDSFVPSDRTKDKRRRVRSSQFGRRWDRD